MRCPSCGNPDTKVIDSRVAEEGRSIRRRRECESCAHRFTTFERTDPATLLVEKRSGETEPFSREKLLSGIVKAFKNRPTSDEELERLAEDVIETLRSHGNVVKSEVLGLEVLERLRSLDEVAYLRFASVYKDFQELTDFERELGLLQKKAPPKQRTGVPTGE